MFKDKIVVLIGDYNNGSIDVRLNYIVMCQHRSVK